MHWGHQDWHSSPARAPHNCGGQPLLPRMSAKHGSFSPWQTLVVECKPGGLTPISQVGRPRQAESSGLPRWLPRSAKPTEGWPCGQFREVSLALPSGRGLTAGCQPIRTEETEELQGRLENRIRSGPRGEALAWGWKAALGTYDRGWGAVGWGERWGYGCRDAASLKRRLPSGSTPPRSALRPAVGPVGPGQTPATRHTHGWAVRVEFVPLQQDGRVPASRCRVQPAGWSLCLPLAGSGGRRSSARRGRRRRLPGCRPLAGLRLTWRRSGGPAGKPGAAGKPGLALGPRGQCVTEHLVRPSAAAGAGVAAGYGPAFRKLPSDGEWGNSPGWRPG